jgi:hypothetical protein
LHLLRQTLKGHAALLLSQLGNCCLTLLDDLDLILDVDFVVGKICEPASYEVKRSKDRSASSLQLEVSTMKMFRLALAGALSAFILLTCIPSKIHAACIPPPPDMVA